MAASVEENVALAPGHVITVRPGDRAVVKVVPATCRERQTLRVGFGIYNDIPSHYVQFSHDFG